MSGWYLKISYQEWITSIQKMVRLDGKTLKYRETSLPKHIGNLRHLDVKMAEMTPKWPQSDPKVTQSGPKVTLKWSKIYLKSYVKSM